MQRALVAASALALVACASTGERRHGAGFDPGDDYDAVKVATVTQWAQARGAVVVWINYPRKRRDGDGG
jgi:hypothetical protein